METITTEPPPNLEAELEPLAKPARVETDVYCGHCGYNLHTLDIKRDRRLGILVTRCPECGTFHAAGQTTGAGRVWLERLGTMLLTGWVFFILGVLVLCTIFMGTFSAIYLESSVWWQGSSGLTLRPTATPEQQIEMMIEVTLLFSLSALSAFVAGTFVAVFLWHLKRSRLYFLTLIFPFIAASFVALAWLPNSYVNNIREWVVVQILIHLGLQLAVMVIGFAIGRPLARGMLRLLVNRPLLQYVGFLWTIDGKKPPAAIK